MSRFANALAVGALLGSVGCGGSSGQLVADSGPHSAIVATNGYVLWIRNGDPETSYPGAVNLVPVGGSTITTLVREGAVQSQYHASLGQSFALSGDQVYFTTSFEIAAVPLTAPGQFTSAFKPGGAAVAANSDHVFWTDWQEIVSHNVVDGTETMIPTTVHSSGPPVMSMAADDSQLYYLDSTGLMVAPASGGAPAVLTAEHKGPTHPIFLAGGFVYRLAFDGIAKIATAGGAVGSVASESDPIDHFAIDDQFVYWTSGHTTCMNPDNCPTKFHVRRQSLAGGSISTLGTLDLQAESMAATGGHAYVLTPSGLHVF